jgi:hypothetical protein
MLFSAIYTAFGVFSEPGFNLSQVYVGQVFNVFNLQRVFNPLGPCKPNRRQGYSVDAQQRGGIGAGGANHRRDGGEER